MALGANALAGALSAALATQHDSFLTDENSTVEIVTRGRIFHWQLKHLPLAGPVSFSVQSHFAAPFEQLTGILDAANKFITGGLGISYRQPWFNYRVWQSTDPISFEIPLVFIARFNAREEVWNPVLRLISLTMPMLAGDASTLDLGVVERGGATIATLAARALPQGADESPITFTVAEGDTGQLRSFIPPGPNIANLFEGARVPFASLFNQVTGALTGRGVNGRNKDRPVSVFIGSYFRFHSCYVDTVSVSLDPLMSPEGFPLRASVQVSCRSLGAPYLNRQGQIVMSGGGDFAGSSGHISRAIGG